MKRLCAVVAILGSIAGCRGTTTLERLSEARQLADELLLQFTKAADAGNRAVMADTDDQSARFAREAEAASTAVQQTSDHLQQLLQSLNSSRELGLLDEFRSRFAEYQTLDRTILGLAVENTNIKAEHLSFGPVREAADAMRDALEALAPIDSRDEWRMKALAATALASVRDIQASQAAHVAEADDQAMANLEKRIASSDMTARTALTALQGLVAPAVRPRLAAAASSLDRVMALNAQIVELSRRNTNVRSLALSMNQKRTLAAACEESLGALRDALAMRRTFGTR